VKTVRHQRRGCSGAFRNKGQLCGRPLHFHSRYSDPRLLRIWTQFFKASSPCFLSCLQRTQRVKRAPYVVYDGINVRQNLSPFLSRTALPCHSPQRQGHPQGAAKPDAEPCLCCQSDEHLQTEFLPLALCLQALLQSIAVPVAYIVSDPPLAAHLCYNGAS